MSTNKENKEIKDAWLKDTNNAEYIKFINGAFGVQKNPKANQTIEPVQIIEKREEEKKKYLLEEEKVGGENFYILKIGKIGGSKLERPVLFRKSNLIQIKQSGNKPVEKDLGRIQKLENGENKFTGKHANKIVLNASVLKEGSDKPRQIYILCENKTISDKILSYTIQNKVLKSFTLIKQDVAPRFKYFLANRFRQSIKNYANYLKAQEENNKSQQKKTFETIFKGFDKKCISEVIQKWKQESQLADKAEKDTQLKEQIKLRNQEKERRWQILKSSEVLKQVDRRNLKTAMNKAIFSARQREMEEKEAERAERVKRTKNEKKLHLQFSQLILSSALRMVRPILDVYYIVNKNIVTYDQYEKRNEDAIIVNKGQQAAPSELVRKINGQNFQKQPEQDELFQMVFTAKMHSKMSDNSYLWNLQPYDGFQTTSQQLQDDTIKFGDLDSCEKDTLKISLYDEMNRQKQYITFVTVSDLISAQTTTKQIWLNFSLESMKNFNTKILLKANIFRTPTIKSQTHSSFDDFLDIFGSKQFEMVDPIYLIRLKNLSLIRSSWIYFLEKLIDEGLGSNSSIKLLQFLIDAIEQKDQVEYPQDISDPLIYKDFRKIFYESISMYLTSAYAKTVLQQEDHQQELLEKIGEPDSKYIHKIIKEIQKTKTQISYEDLKRLFIYGVPSRFRCLYWSNFLQINNIIQDDIQRTSDGFVSDSDDLVKRYEYYQKLPEIDCSKSFLDQDEYEIMGKWHADNLEQILSAFTSYLKYHRIVDLTYEDRLRYNLYRFIQRIYICLYPTFMKTEDNLHAGFFTYDKQKSKLQMSLKKIDLNDFTQDEQNQKEQIIRAEIFWFSVAFYNLYFKQLVVMENEQGLQAMKKRIAIGIVAYETMLNPHSKLMIQQNQLQDAIKYQWFKQSTNFFQNTFQSFNFTKILDIVVFEFGMNLMDGFENAVLACFITLLDRIKLDGIINQSQLENAFITEGLFLQQSFFVDLYKNIQTIQKGFDAQLIENQLHNLNFNQFGDLYLPEEDNEKNLKIDKEILETLQTSNNRTLDLGNHPQGNEAGQQNQNLSPQKKQRIVNVKSPFQVRKDFVEQDSEEEKDKLNPIKDYLVSHKVKFDEELINKKNERKPHTPPMIL
ncbi:hypothetical protein TTHERM_00585230 (macronuclear) [Tetrahymena thermophila SB210]|uniref:Uncharacterized protein n=1 Tax=Tetrahymena thermophila (strain SB210) TaxID=312017 RepID=I7LTB9_TETTS|nr:hypothetical protein TTHERM_00585230 [Tetrahymena thermophila SB210]EAR84965.2 hypothetical protein TTHERM_00585230 [Tetrahymena thermophila SB210]|eukprot:XP_001032628.2 hypothetical protein TTHERM_00585230 [Tetrahymena thermophila SB210]